MNNKKLNISNIDKIIYINLKERTDRNEHILSELKKLEMPEDKIVRFEAIKTEPGYLGCSKSHLAVLELAEQEKWKTILILEDDIHIHHDEENITRANSYFEMLENNEWNVALLMGNYFNAKLVENSTSFLELYSSYCSCAYLVNPQYRKTLIENVKESVFFIEQTNKQTYAIDSHWLSLMAKGKWFGLYPCFGHTIYDYSDIQKGYLDYKEFFCKPLSDFISPS